MALVDTLEPQFAELIAQELSIRPQQVHAASALFAEKATVPFVARYRKEATGGLDDEVLETLWKRRQYFLDLAERRDAVLASIEEQGKLTPELEAQIRAATSKQLIEDLYLPYKPKRRTRAQMARERGLEPLADLLLEHAAGPGPADALTAEFVTGETRDGEPVPPEKQVVDADAALAGARDILAERLAERADHRADLRASIFGRGELSVRVFTGKDKDPAAQVFKDYFDHTEPAESVPSHRLLAILRGENEGFLLSDVAVDDELEIHRLHKTLDVPLVSPCGRKVAEASAD
ncbi:MAG: Tex-like N-terminal domain-containing protein, partial [Acidobacteriota bacterium]